MPLWLLLHTLTGLIIGALEADRFQFMATLVFSGLFIGVAQWVVLRQSLRVSPSWIAASAIGWLIGIQITIAMDNWLDRLMERWAGSGVGEVFWMNVVNQFIVLTVMGTAQALLLKSIHSRAVLPSSGWIVSWIGISALGGAVQGGSSAIFCEQFCSVLTKQLGGIFTTAIVYGVGWFSYSLITAASLSKLRFAGDSEH